MVAASGDLTQAIGHLLAAATYLPNDEGLRQALREYLVRLDQNRASAAVDPVGCSDHAVQNLQSAEIIDLDAMRRRTGLAEHGVSRNWVHNEQRRVEHEPEPDSIDSPLVALLAYKANGDTQMINLAPFREGEAAQPLHRDALAKAGVIDAQAPELAVLSTHRKQCQRGQDADGRYRDMTGWMMAAARRSPRRHLWAAIGVVVLMVGAVGGWAAATHVTGAVIAQGTVVVESSVRKVHHPTGGVIGEISVRDGDRVKAGDILVRLDETMIRADLATIARALDELAARKARLEAERNGADSVDFPDDLLHRAHYKEIDLILAGERTLFELRRSARMGQKAQLRQRITQLGGEMADLTAQASAKAQEIVLVQRELVGTRELWEKNLMPITKLIALEREAVRLEDERAQLTARSAQAKGNIAEIELQVIRIDRDLTSEVSKELREVDAKSGELNERRLAVEDQLKRIDIRAPQAGTVHQSIVLTVGGVVSAADPIMLIVPDANSLIVEARVASNEIDQLRLGQDAVLRFSAFNQRTTPEITGKLTRISADITTDPRTGTAYYTVRIGLGSQDIARLGDVKLLPGMPVEAFIKTGDRTVISYLAKPLQDQLVRSFRER